MADNYTYKIEKAEVRVVHDDKQYKILVSEIDFGQTFQEKSFPVKTLHNQSSFEGSAINRANPAEFSLNTALLKEDDHKVIFDRLLDAATFDLYISTTQDVWKLGTCVIQNGTFEINGSKPLRLTVNGEASKLSKHSGAIPGVVQSVTSDATYIVPRLPTVTIGGTDISSCVTSLQIEIQNGIKWNRNNTVHGAVAATDAATSIYPENFVIGTRIVGGSITRYYKEDAPDILTWSTNTALRIRAGKDIGKTVSAINITSGGANYQNPPTVTIGVHPADNTTVSGGGSVATATATISSGQVTAVTITNPGSDFTSVPSVTIAQPAFGGSGQQATATAALSAETVVHGIDFNITNCSFTNRLSTGNTFLEEYNWRMTQNPTALSNVITYTTT